MFIKKDTRKLGEILDGDDVSKLKLARRKREFKGGTLATLCRSSRKLKGSTTYINLYANELTSISGIHQAFAGGCLRELNLGNNLLKILPQELGEIKSLRSLWLEDNQLEKFPECLYELDRLTCLRLSSNKITKLPAQVVMMRGLEDLALDSNRLSELPETLNELVGLRRLNVRQNKIMAFPDLGALHELLTLAASSNLLEAPPPGLAKLAKLEEVYLNGNKLKEFPIESLGLGALKTLNLANNQIPNPLPPSVLEKYGELDPKGIKLDSDEVDVVLRGNPCCSSEAPPGPIEIQ
mmetsp:Transcript_12673/g.29821  ORF Transcript_12673/g.29821 Transcript_12673/m.29821 type:complete len:295 (+) Transcript_12673:63-947(+)|eukprot:CAMPEP_0172651294 /NCGR_PEP_ID=MMETSP1068-20121228/242727_1 /TAXON_ID=35684 /ORGANISM="Pseudopedinella elastica, Strain CCMP716" /LENGTH=294 /DNA_ID=CAMNT_0013465679 /DNA_START=69 /DNA_END=953 /DNA_ORIENTATION=+